VTVWQEVLGVFCPDWVVFVRIEGVADQNARRQEDCFTRGGCGERNRCAVAQIAGAGPPAHPSACP
jgi:hypothetical protein